LIGEIRLRERKVALQLRNDINEGPTSSRLANSLLGGYALIAKPVENGLHVPISGRAAGVSQTKTDGENHPRPGEAARRLKLSNIPVQIPAPNKEVMGD
jgi:hypothetical protein